MDSDNFREVAVSEPFRWDSQRDRAAIALAAGKTHKEAAADAECSDRTIRNWLENDEFAAEVDRLTLLTGIASKSERLRICKRVVRQLTNGSEIKTEKDLLDWFKFAQSETSGANMNILGLAAQLSDASESESTSIPANAPPLAGGGQAGAKSDTIN